MLVAPEHLDITGVAYPGATIYSCAEHGLEETDYDDTDPVRMTKSFLDAKDRFLYQLPATDRFSSSIIPQAPHRIMARKNLDPDRFTA